jgi:hypothetical protein
VVRVSARNLFPAANSHNDPSAQNNPFGRGFGCHIDCMIAGPRASPRDSPAQNDKE